MRIELTLETEVSDALYQSLLKASKEPAKARIVRTPGPVHLTRIRKVSPPKASEPDWNDLTFIETPTEEFPEGSECPVHKRVHGAHGWHICVLKGKGKS